MTAKRRILIPDLPMPAPAPKPPRKDSLLMPIAYHRFDRLTTCELSHKIKAARELDLTSDELLNLIVSLKRSNNFNQLNSLLEFLVQLR